MMARHYSLMFWDPERWPNFTAEELACRHCGESFYDPESFDMLQRARTATGKPYVLNSVHRCVAHNADIGGAKKSQHLEIAFDISTEGHDRARLLQDLIDAGFRSFGFYQNFIHADKRQRNRRWFAKKGIVDDPKTVALWKGVPGVIA